MYTELTAIVTEELGKSRLDKALAQLFPQYSRARLQQCLKAGLVLLNDEVITKLRTSVTAGDKIAVSILETVEQPWQAEAIDLDLVYEDQDLIIVNKPAGLVVHPGAGNKTGTLLNALLHFDSNLEKVPRAGIVHRLDKDTSGIMVIARTIEAQTSLVRQLQDRVVKRQYEAVVYGELVAGFTIDENIGRHPKDRIKMAVVSNGKEAITHIRVLEKLKGFTRIQANLETGRTHQIRVHMAHKHYPLVGDKTYAPRFNLPKGLQFPRQALHAKLLSLQHPTTKEIMEWEVALPNDLEKLLQSLRDL